MITRIWRCLIYLTLVFNMCSCYANFESNLVDQEKINYTVSNIVYENFLEIPIVDVIEVKSLGASVFSLIAVAALNESRYCRMEQVAIKVNAKNKKILDWWPRGYFFKEKALCKNYSDYISTGHVNMPDAMIDMLYGAGKVLLSEVESKFDSFDEPKLRSISFQEYKKSGNIKYYFEYSNVNESIGYTVVADYINDKIVIEDVRGPRI